jgi:hypothetical protein
MAMTAELGRGRLAHCLSPLTLPWAVDELVVALTVERAKSLKVRPGEHLAAILATAFFGAAPYAVDEDGNQPDLQFNLDTEVPRSESLCASLIRNRLAPGGLRGQVAAVRTVAEVRRHDR